MRPDQLVSIKTLQEKLADHFIREADPDSWPGAGLASTEMDKDDRGDQYWCKKNAAATLAIIVRVQWFLTVKTDGENLATADEEVDIEAQQRQAEKDASKMIADMQSRIRAKSTR